MWNWEWLHIVAEREGDTDRGKRGIKNKQPQNQPRPMTGINTNNATGENIDGAVVKRK